MALFSNVEELKLIQTIPSDDFKIKVNKKITDVVFVIHGIRDTAYWTHKVARRIKALGDSAISEDKRRMFSTETSSYGYFPILSFLNPSHRNRKVEWLMDQYTENLIKYPNAKFSYVGHSNGTYLLAKALNEYECEFKNIVFAGSVVPQEYNWNKKIEEKKVEKIFNIVTTSDWVVACVPKALRSLNVKDLGSAGFDGFSSISDQFQIKYAPGSHFSGLTEQYWDSIAEFIVYGNTDKLHAIPKKNRSRGMQLLGDLAPIPFVLLILLLGVLIPLASYKYYFSCKCNIECKHWTLIGTVVYIYVLKQFLARF